MVSRPNTESLPERTAYAKPILTQYGRLKDLTTGGSGTKPEDNQADNPKP